jgi:methylenetetrahydrofolate reductase (NADPH)
VYSDGLGHLIQSFSTVLTRTQSADATNLWGTPTEFNDITTLFANFCRGTLLKLPWSTQPPSSETSVITEQLAKMNEMGYLTINSQPAVDGARSDDKIHGWGPAGGYVYQKVRPCL